MVCCCDYGNRLCHSSDCPSYFDQLYIVVWPCFCRTFRGSVWVCVYGLLEHFQAPLPNISPSPPFTYFSIFAWEFSTLWQMTREAALSLACVEVDKVIFSLPKSPNVVRLLGPYLLFYPSAWAYQRKVRGYMVVIAG